MDTDFCILRHKPGSYCTFDFVDITGNDSTHFVSLFVCDHAELCSWRPYIYSARNNLRGIFEIFTKRSSV